MDGEFTAPRRELQTLLQSMGFIPWIFEFTPPSSEDPTVLFLRKARESDITIWVSNGVTSESVRDEVRAALEANRPVLSFLVRTGTRDTTTQRVIEAVRASPQKTQDLENWQELSEAVAAALAGEVARRFRGFEGSRPSTMVFLEIEAEIEVLKRRSIARCYQRFASTGLTTDLSLVLAKDRNFGAVACISELGRGVHVIVGNVGSGKSLAVDRAHQAAIDTFQSGGTIPIWIPAYELDVGLEAAVIQRCDNLGDPKFRGVHVVIDGLDEALINERQIVIQALQLSQIWPDSTFLITSRPIGETTSSSEITPMPPLTEMQILNLIKLTGREVSNLNHLTTSMKETLARPLFALLYGQRRDTASIIGPFQLVGEQIETTLRHQNDPNLVFDTLKHLAVETVSRGGPVPLTEISNSREIERCGLVISDGKSIRFGLASIEEWFASRAIGHEIELSVIVSDPSLLDRWRFSIVAAIASRTSNEVATLLELIAKTTPAVLPWLLSMSFPKFSFDYEIPLPPSMQSGAQLRGAMESFIVATGPASYFLSPLNEGGALLPLLIHTEGNQIDVCWSRDPEYGVESVSEFPKGAVPKGSRIRSGNVEGRSGWEWLYALSQIKADLKFVLERQTLPVPPVLQAEWDWALSSQLLNHVTLNQIPIECSSVIAKILSLKREGFERIGISIGPRVRQFTDADLAALAERMEDRGEYFEPPWPGRDNGVGSSIWKGYSTNRLIERVKMIYSAAYEANEWLSTNIFPTIAPMLVTYATRPAKVRMWLNLPEDYFGSESHPTLLSYIEPTTGAGSLDFEVVAVDTRSEMPNISEVDPWKNYQGKRPSEQFTGLSIQLARLDVFGNHPALDIAYDLLKSDLRRLRWID